MNDTISKNNLADDLINLYRRNNGLLETTTGRLLNRYRGQAFQDFGKLGIPTVKNENYKYTHLEKYLADNYDEDLEANPFKIDVRSIFQCDVPNLDTHMVLMLNGFYYADDLHGELPEGLIICSLNEASSRYAEIFEKHYNRYADTSVDGLVALNTLFAHDGIFVYIPENTKLKKPLQIINMSFSDKNLRITRRNLVVASDNVKAGIVVCDHTLSNHSFLTNSLTEIYAGSNTKMNYDWLQNENGQSVHINNLFIHQEKDSSFESSIVSLHGGLIRNNFYAVQAGQNSETNFNGLFLCDDRQHVANYVLMDHASPHGTSNQLFKGILNDEATGSFNGKILVRQDAQKIQAYQKNNNIMLSPAARMNTKPHLEIYADDVKCSHGATVGQLDSEALFYIRSRGIGAQEAQHLLKHAFANDIVGRISVPALKEWVTDLVDKRLRGELSGCNECRVTSGLITSSK